MSSLSNLFMLLPGPPRLERNPQAHTGCGGEPLKRARRRLHPAAFETRDHRLRRVHALGQLFLRETRMRARLNHRLGERELVLKRVVGLDVCPVLAPRSEGFLDRDHLPAHVTSFARCRANSISRRGVFWVFFTNTRRITTRLPVAVT